MVAESIFDAIIRLQFFDNMAGNLTNYHFGHIALALYQVLSSMPHLLREPPNYSWTVKSTNKATLFVSMALASLVWKNSLPHHGRILLSRPSINSGRDVFRTQEVEWYWPTTQIWKWRTDRKWHVWYSESFDRAK